MGVSWLFLDGTRPLEIWAKCECGKWNKVCEKEEISDFKPAPEKPIKKMCKKCDAEIEIQRVYFARKGMRKPREDC